MLKNFLLIINVDLFVNFVIFVKRGMGKRQELLVLRCVVEIDAISNVLIIKSVIQMDAYRKMIKEFKADIVVYAACKLMIYLLI